MGSDEGGRVRVEDIPEPLLEQVVNSKGFQKMLAYRKLGDGIEVLEEHDVLFDQLVSSILDKHSSVQSRRSVEEFFELFVEEVKEYTEGIIDEDLDADVDDPLAELYVDRGVDDGE